MKKLRLLIVDDDEDNRVVLKAICKKIECFEIQEATDGLESVKITETWQPHIILMDIMMPNMDGIEASNIIKEKYPNITIIVITAVLDTSLQQHLSTLGIDIFISKPIDRDLIRFKLQSLGSSLSMKLGSYGSPSRKIALNPFNSDIRSFKTFFEIVNTEAMMDFGMWLFDQYNGKGTTASSKFDRVIEVFYMLMNQGNKNGEVMSIIIEESYEEFYITMKFESAITIDEKLSDVFDEFGSQIILKENIVCVRLSKPTDIKISIQENVEGIKEIEKQTYELAYVEKEKIIEEEKEIIKEVKVIDSNEKELLKQSFVNKTSAIDYVDEIGGDVLDEIRDLASIDEEWILKLREIEEDPTRETLIRFTDSVLNVYVKAINNLFEFTALAYALSSLGAFIKDSADSVSQDSSKIKMLIMLLEHLGTDLSSWREHIFIMQDTADIHYLDSSFFSSCMQIEGIISNKDIGAHDDDNDMEFF